MTKRKYLPQGLTALDRLIVALDFDKAPQAHAMVDRLGDVVSFYKVGWQLFLGAGFDFVRELLDKEKKVFLDLKINDIEATVRAALNNMPKDLKGKGGIELLTIHGNGPTVEAAKLGRNGSKKPYLLMITALSSMDDSDMRDVHSNESVTRSNIVKVRAQKALDAGCEGLIASGESVKELRRDFADRDFLIVSPGIRPSGSPQDDHKRTLTPYDAIVDGSDYIVVGRPITRANDPLESAKEIIADIEKALDDLERRNSNFVQEDSSHKRDYELNPAWH